MRFHDAINGMFFIVLGVAILVVASGFPQMPGQQIGPSSFPTVIGFGMVLGGGIVLALSLRRKLAMPLLVVDPGWLDPRHLACALFCLFGSLALGLQFEKIGFPLGSLVLCFGIYALAGIAKPTLFMMAAVFVSAVALVMTKLLYVPLPMGNWL